MSFKKIARRLGGMTLLVATIAGCWWHWQQPAETISPAQIKQRQTLRVAIPADLIPPSHDIDASVELSLAHELADELGVKLSLLPFDRLEQVPMLLQSGQVDIALAVPGTSPVMNGLALTDAYMSVNYYLVHKNSVVRPRNLSELNGQLRVPAGSRVAELLIAEKFKDPSLTWNESAQNYGSLMSEVIDETVEFTLAPSPIYAIKRNIYPELMAGFPVSEPEAWHWAVDVRNDELYLKVQEFVQQRLYSGQIADLIARALEPLESNDYLHARLFMDGVLQRLPSLRTHFVRAAGNDLDWRLLAAIAYQESHWRTRAVSPTGVRGVMMLTQDTAAELGVENRNDPAQSIRGGAEYFRLMHDKIPGRIQEPDRTWFTLAAYNIGFGHLEDARILTQRAGDDPDNWADVAKHLPKLRDPNIYPKTKRGYARGDEPVTYVHNIQRYYATLRWLEDLPDAEQLRRIAGIPLKPRVPSILDEDNAETMLAQSEEQSGVLTVMN